MNPFPGIPKGASGRPDPQASWWNAPLYRNEELIEQPADQTTLTRRYTEEAVKFLREQKSKPFFLYFPHTFPHVPLFASKQFSGTSSRGLYGDVVEELDWSVGQVLDTLRQEKLSENTIVFFSSDNGPWLIMNQQGGSAGLLREGKGCTWEGGMRVPAIAWWPRKIKSGSVARGIASTMDLFTTSLKLAGAELPNDRPIDGLDLTEVLLRGEPTPRESFFYYRGTRLFAVRKGAFKAHLLTQAGYGQPKHSEHSPPLLFNLLVDPGESFNVAESHPEIVADLLREVELHRATVTPAKNQLEAIAPPPNP